MKNEYVKSCEGCPYWGGHCQHGDMRQTESDALCYEDENSYINRVRD